MRRYSVCGNLKTANMPSYGDHCFAQIRLFYLWVSLDFRKHISLLFSCSKNVIKLYNAHTYASILPYLMRWNPNTASVWECGTAKDIYTMNDIVFIVFFAICVISKNLFCFFSMVWDLLETAQHAADARNAQLHIVKMWIKTIWPSRVSNGHRISALPIRLQWTRDYVILFALAQPFYQLV